MTAKKWGGTIVIPLTHFLEEGKRYTVHNAKIDGEPVIVIKELKLDIEEKDLELKT